MSSCPNCGTIFNFSDMLLTVNPARINCSGCTERISSSYFTLLVIFLVFLLVSAIILVIELPGEMSSGLAKLVAIGVIGFIFEFGYFYILAKGVIKSNLNIKNTHM